MVFSNESLVPHVPPDVMAVTDALTDAANSDRQQMKQREFMQLLPLSLAIAGLPTAPVGTYFNEGQMELRANSIRNAFKFARQLIVDQAK